MPPVTVIFANNRQGYGQPRNRPEKLSSGLKRPYLTAAIAIPVKPGPAQERSFFDQRNAGSGLGQGLIIIQMQDFVTEGNSAKQVKHGI
ncbi:hypothetical protein [Leptodesmis sichuanensis]|uniref:hypothetical protein n=1 Tax=Leptodesmis sichuanensis TaxID=2906798 RepID=UPI001F343F00|nr:hypothetical protein [Leptodesmis sichuanensis]UIE37674.1 hypothetical protein KIK02_22570 [Leptodesmis sichuanensis A121]